jgi:hypothetical protein
MTKGKLQIPSSNIQRTFNFQIPNGVQKTARPTDARTFGF